MKKLEYSFYQLFLLFFASHVQRQIIVKGKHFDGKILGENFFYRNFQKSLYAIKEVMKYILVT